MDDVIIFDNDFIEGFRLGKEYKKGLQLTAYCKKILKQMELKDNEDE
jgi:hypothetical protein